MRKNSMRELRILFFHAFDKSCETAANAFAAWLCLTQSSVLLSSPVSIASTGVNN